MNIKETKNAKTRASGTFRRFGALVLAFSMIFGSWMPAIAVAAPTPTVVEERAEKPAATPAETETQAPDKTTEPASAQAEQVPAKTEEKPAVETQSAPSKAKKNAPQEDGLEIAKPEEKSAVQGAQSGGDNAWEIEAAAGKSSIWIFPVGKDWFLNKGAQYIVDVSIVDQNGRERVEKVKYYNNRKGREIEITLKAVPIDDHTSVYLQEGDQITVKLTATLRSKIVEQSEQTVTVKNFGKIPVEDPYDIKALSWQTSISGKSMTRREVGPRSLELRAVAYDKDPREPGATLISKEPGRVSDDGNFSIRLDKKLREGETVFVKVLKYVRLGERDPKWNPADPYIEMTPEMSSVGSATVQLSLQEKYETAKIVEFAKGIKENYTVMDLTLNKYGKYGGEERIQINRDILGKLSEALKEQHPEAAQEIKKVEFEPSTEKHPNQSLTITYTDGTVSVVPMPNIKLLKAKPVPTPVPNEVYINSKGVTGTLVGDLPKTVEVRVLFPLTDNQAKGYCPEGECEFGQKLNNEYLATINYEDKTFSCDFTKAPEGVTLTPIKLNAYEYMGIVVYDRNQDVTKDKRYKVCMKFRPSILLPAEKTPVKDPKNLTEQEEEQVREALRQANTIDGKSRLPQGTGLNVGGMPTIIDFDKDGNVKIISPNDVVVDHFEGSGNNRKAVLAKNPDGTHKVKPDKLIGVISTPIKGLVTNTAPEAPTFGEEAIGAGQLTITPPKYVNRGEDTDLASYALTYTEVGGAQKTVTATRDPNTDQWSVTGGVTIDEATGVIKLDVNDLAVGSALTAVAKDRGGLVPEEQPLESKKAPHTMKTVSVRFEPNEGSGSMQPETVNKGGKYSLPAACTFEAPQYKKFKGWKVGNQEYQPGAMLDEHLLADTVVLPEWEYKKVKVTYSAGEGSGSMEALENNAEEINMGSDYTLKKNTFKAPKYKEFDKWEVKGAKHAETDTLPEVTDPITVTALWKWQKVEVEYKAGNGSGVMDPAVDKTDLSQDYTVRENTFKAPTDQEFAFWEANDYQQTNTEELKKHPGDVFKIYKRTTLTAQWKDIQVDIVYQAGAHGSGKDIVRQASQNKDFTLEGELFTPDKNYRFIGWSDGKNASLQPGDKLNAGMGKILVAQWELMERTISFDPGDGGSGSMNPVVKVVGEKYALPKNGFTAPENMEFSHWTVEGETGDFQPGQQFTVQADTKVTAHWKDIKFTVTYVANGGSGTMNPETVLKKDGQGYTLKANEFTPQTGWEFEGWKIGSKVYPAGANYPVTGNTTATAQWRLETIGITFATEEGGEGPGNAPLRHPKGVLYYLPKPEFKAKDGYQFKGWKIGDNPEIKKAGTSTTFDRDTVITAVWDQLVTVTYDANEGAWFGGNTKITNQVPKNSSFKLSWGPMRKGYVFLGWQQSEPAVQDAPTLAANGMHDGTDVPLTFKAVWREKGSSGNTPGVPPVIPGVNKETAVITMDPNGGNWGGDTGSRTYSVKIGETYILDPAPVREGYTFVCWRGSSYQPGDAYVVEGSHTFTAEWKKDEETPEVKKPSVPSETVPIDRDALLRRLKLLWSKQVPEKVPAIPRAGVGTAERTVSTVLFPVDFLPAKKREED